MDVCYSFVSRLGVIRVTEILHQEIRSISMFRTPGLVSQMSYNSPSFAHSLRLYTIMRGPQGVQTPLQISGRIRNRRSLIDMLGERDQSLQYSELSFPCETVNAPEIDEQESNFEDILVTYERSQRRAHVGEACAQVIDV